MNLPSLILGMIQDGYHPHGFCYLWKPSLVWLHAGSDSVIAGAYYAIPLGLVYFVRRRSDIPFNWVFIAFAAFIVACGSTHIMAVWTLWQPDYWASGMVKVLTAGASLATAVALVPLIPKAVRLPSLSQWEQANDSLTKEIAERERAEAEVRRLNSELTKRVAELESRNQELELFSQSMSHDLRSPLRAMRGFAEILIEEHSAGLDDEGLDYARRIRRAGENMDALIHDLLEYARVDRADRKMERIPLETLVQDARQQIASVLDYRNAEVQIDGDLSDVLGDRTLLLQVMANLLVNAATFVPADRAPSIHVTTVTTGNTVRVLVKDNGIGIADEYQERIFGLFERLHGRGEYPGTGIGLAIVAKSIEQMDGRAGVDSQEGGGSTFWFELQRGDTA